MSAVVCCGVASLCDEERECVICQVNVMLGMQFKSDVLLLDGYRCWPTATKLKESRKELFLQIIIPSFV